MEGMGDYELRVPVLPSLPKSDEDMKRRINIHKGLEYLMQVIKQALLAAKRSRSRRILRA